MAKELPFFKFYISDWLTGDITLCNEETQGVFITLCAFYWKKKCSMSLANAKQRFSKNESNIKELIENNIIKIDEDDNIIINFLDEQMKEFIEISEKRAKYGSIGGKAKAKQKPKFAKAKSSYIEAEAEAEADNILGTKVPDEEIKISPPVFSIIDDEDQEKKKNIKPKKQKETSITHKLRLEFESYYKKEKLEDYYYQAKDASQLTNIISKIKFIIKKRQGENYKITEKDLISSWKYILFCLKEDDPWVYDNLSIPNINSKFNEIISKINDGRKTKQQVPGQKGTSVEQLANIVAKHFTKGGEQ